MIQSVFTYCGTLGLSWSHSSKSQIKTPPDPSYVKNGSTAKLVWDYSDTNNELQSIIFSVQVHDQGAKVYKNMLVKQNGFVIEHQEIPSAYKGRVRFEGNATLVIDNITPKDNTKFLCQLIAASTWISRVTLIVAGMYYKVFSRFLLIG